MSSTVFRKQIVMKVDHKATQYLDKTFQQWNYDNSTFLTSSIMVKMHFIFIFCKASSRRKTDYVHRGANALYAVCATEQKTSLGTKL